MAAAGRKRDIAVSADGEGAGRDQENGEQGGDADVGLRARQGA